MEDKKKRRLPKSCIFCRRSHIVCDEKRPCSRCIKRNISHLCSTNEPDITISQQNINSNTMMAANVTSSPSSQQTVTNLVDSNNQSTNMKNTSTVNNISKNSLNNNLSSNNNTDTNANFNTNFSTNNNNDNIPPTNNTTNIPNVDPNLNDNTNVINNNNNNISNLNNIDLTNYILPQTFISPNVGSEFNSLNEFLSILENPLSLPNEVNNNVQDINNNYPTSSNNDVNTDSNNSMNTVVPVSAGNNIVIQSNTNNNFNNPVQTNTLPTGNNDNNTDTTNINSNNNPFKINNNEKVSAKEQFFITAADPSVEMTPEDRLKLVINAKLEAGLLKPYNYANGYTRLQEYMELNMTNVSRQRILKPLYLIRPAFRTIAKSLKDIDLILVEENFERILLSYDRVFTSMSMPACIWRRTGEIYRANKEFASLVNCPVNLLRDGKLAIYELMNEDSTVNYWEKYGSIAFDQGQKTVLTSCSLLDKVTGNERRCCFSFTIRRDRYNIPICIVGNFIPIS